MNLRSFIQSLAHLLKVLPIFPNPNIKRGKENSVIRPNTRKTATKPQLSMNQPVSGKMTIIDRLNIMELILSMVARTLEGR